MEIKERVEEKFKELFGKEGKILTFFAPGRVNLIGEHTDYNGGHVFPCALTIGTYAAVRKREDEQLRFYSMNFEQDGIVKSEISALEKKKEGDWTNYPKGMIWTLRKKGYQIETGMDMLLFGNIPNGSGLSSSASVEIVTGIALNELFRLGLDRARLALFGQYSEHYYNGVNCGIMDQFAVAMGKKNHAIFLNTADLSYEYVPIHLENSKIVIACSNKKRGLGDSKYNERRNECEEAVRRLKKKLSMETLGDLTEEEFEKNKELIGDPVLIKRAKHAVYENRRTLKAVEALKNDDIRQFGRLMNESHISLRDDYEVTGKELDCLAEAAWRQPGVIGSRMTGAGFGGCTVSIVEDEWISSFIEGVGKRYRDKIGYQADFYIVQIGGAE